MTKQKPEWEVRMDRIEAMMEESAKRWEYIDKELMPPFLKAVTALSQLQIQDYRGPVESEPASD